MTAADDHNDDVPLAGEYALHLLDADERSAFEDRLNKEPALRLIVAEWNADFVVLSDDIEPVTPPAQVKAKIDTLLFADPKKPRAGWSIWRLMAGAGAALVLGLAVLVVVPPGDETIAFTPRFAANIAAEDQSLVVRASYSPEAGVLRIDQLAGTARPGRVLELWLIAEGAAAPVSLGVLPDQASTDITLPDALVDQIDGGTLAISDEPIGGSTTGAPTGDVLAAGAVISI
ncbi:anti-sigma factor [Yoonia algicola]|uniref:Regulator of SigK n=1 Tax=Yoonia algicola TaxID=3137368 RepID=A0AAN0M1F2_9RHOB